LCYNQAMLAQLLSSKPKTQLINLLLAHPKRAFSFTELRLLSRCPQKLLRATLRELDKMNFLVTSEKKRIRYYQMNRRFALYPELIGFLRKAKHVPKDILALAAGRVGDCKLVALTGVFVGKPRVETDLLFVGRISASRLENFLKLASKLAEQEVGFTVLTPQEFDYRRVMNDRFVKNILENDPVLAVDKIKKK